MKRLIRGDAVVTLDDADQVFDPGIFVFDENTISCASVLPFMPTYGFATMCMSP